MGVGQHYEEVKWVMGGFKRKVVLIVAVHGMHKGETMIQHLYPTMCGCSGFFGITTPTNNTEKLESNIRLPNCQRPESSC